MPCNCRPSASGLRGKYPAAPRLGSQSLCSADVKAGARGANLGFVIDIRLGQPLFDHLQIDWILDNVQVIRNLTQQKSP